MTSDAPPVVTTTPVEWVRVRLFKNWWSGLLTLLLFPAVLYMGYRTFLFFFVNGQWEAVQRNLTLFMIGLFPREEMARIITQILIFALAFGVGLGTNAAASKDRADDAGLEFERGSILDTAKRMWSLIAFIALLLFFASTDGVGGIWAPYLLVLGTLGVAYVGYQARLMPRRFRNVGWLLTIVLLIVGFQVVSGFDAGGWVPMAVILGLATFSALPVDRFEAAWLRLTLRIVATVVVAVVLRTVYRAVDAPGIGWDEWSGLHLTLMVSAIAIVLAFPLGLLLALGRRSTLPAVRIMSTVYIEVIRGVPLITLLFMGQFILGFMLPAGTDLSAISRAIAAMTLFTAAYVAEIVRGGLQALPKGQTEAGQALGLAPPTIMRRIVLPQALRAVIPAMVGQFISLFKDSSLLFIISIVEFLRVRSLVHAQPDFRAVSIAETLVFVAIGYWAFAFAMSRESQRLENRLRVSR